MSASVRAASTGAAGSAAADLSLLRGAPARGVDAQSQAPGARQGGTDPGPGPSATAGATQESQGGTADTTQASADAPVTSSSRATFGETLAASMSAPSSPSGTTPARGTKPRTTATSADATSAAGLLLAVPPAVSPVAGGAAPTGLAAQVTSSLPRADSTPRSGSLPGTESAPGTETALRSGAALPGSGQLPGKATDAGAALTSASPTDSATGQPATDATASTAAAAPAGDTRAIDALGLAAAQLPGMKPVIQASEPGRSTPSDQLDAPTAADSSPASAPGSAANAATLVTGHVPPPQLAASGTRTGGGATSSGQLTQSAGTAGDSGTASAALGAAGAGSAGQAPASSAPAPSPVTVTVHSEVGSSAFPQELGMRLNWMAQAGVGSASLRLTPEQLGPVEVRISVHQNTASVWFGATQPETRTALEQALPKLREMFSSQGLNLAHTGVSDQSPRGAQRDPQPAAVTAPGAYRELTVTQVTSRPAPGKGLVDTYA